MNDDITVVKLPPVITVFLFNLFCSEARSPDPGVSDPAEDTCLSLSVKSPVSSKRGWSVTDQHQNHCSVMLWCCDLRGFWLAVSEPDAIAHLHPPYSSGGDIIVHCDIKNDVFIVSVVCELKLRNWVTEYYSNTPVRRLRHTAEITQVKQQDTHTHTHTHTQSVYIPVRGGNLNTLTATCWINTDAPEEHQTNTPESTWTHTHTHASWMNPYKSSSTYRVWSI